MKRKNLVFVLGYAALLILMLPGLVFAGGARDEERVVVYSGSGSDVSEQYFEAFTKATGIRVDPIYGGGGELLNRIAAESRNPLGDVLIGATSDVLAAFTDYFEPFILESVEPHQIGQETLEKGYWAEGAGGNIMILMVNTNLLAEEDIPRTWKDLADPKYFGKIAMGDPTASSSAYIHLNIMYQLYGWDFVEAFYRNLNNRIISSSGAIPRSTADGEYAIALTIENFGADYAPVAPHIEVIYPEDGTMRTAGGSVIIKNGPNPENAKKFVEFMYSKEVAEVNVSFNRRPMRADVDLPLGLAPFEEINFMEYDYELAGNRQYIIDNWVEIITRN